MTKSLLSVIVVLLLPTGCCRAQGNEDLSGGLVWESEPYLAIDPAAPQHMVVAWMGNVYPSAGLNIKTITSFNGGATWSSPVVIPHQSPTYTSADVSIAFGHTGDVYLTFIDSRQSPDSGGVYIVKSANGGLSWGTASQVISAFADGTKYPLDRPWLTISKTSGVTPDTLYVTTKPAPWVSPPNRPYFEKSYDSGLTWDAWRYIDTTGYLVGNVVSAPMAAPAIDSGGGFHCVYPSYLPSQSVYPQYIMASAKPGNSFNYHVVYTSIGAGTIDSLAKAGARLICDPTNNKHFAFVHIENLYGDLDVFSLETTDGGATWSSQLRVNDDAVGNGKMQDMTWANFDENGNLVAAWRDRRNAPGTGYEQPTEIWGAVKWKDSANFSANFELSDTAAPYDSVYLFGAGNDFMNVSMAQDTLSAVWGDVRTGALNIWFARRAMRSDTTSTTTIVKSIVREPIPIVSIYPNPASGEITFYGKHMTSITLSDLSGKTILQRKINGDKVMVDVTGLASGVYVATVETGNGVVSEKVEVR